MNWYILKNNKCPRCHGVFSKDLKQRKNLERIAVNGMLGRDWQNVEVVTLIHSCGFAITEKKYKEIVSEMVVKNLSKEIYGEE